MIIQLGSIIFNNNIADSNGAYWYITEYQGWHDTDLDAQEVGFTSRDGGARTRAVLRPRSVMLEGVCKAPSSSAYYASQQLLMGQTNLRMSSGLLKFTEDITRRLNVYKAGRININHLGIGSFEFQIPLMAFDPLKYSDTLNTESLGASTVINNGGTFATAPIVTLSGAGTITLTNDSIVGDPVVSFGSLTSGTVIDFYNRTALNGASDQFGQINDPVQWWALQPGANTILKGGTAAASISWRDAWL